MAAPLTLSLPVASAPACASSSQQAQPVAYITPPRRRVLLAAGLSAALLLSGRCPSHAAVPASASSPALLHAVLRVRDLESAGKYFVDALGMTRLRSRPGNLFVGYGTESLGQHFSLELSPFDAGEVSPDAAGFGGLVLAVDNPSAAAARAVGAGGRRTGGGRCSGDAFAGCAVTSPDGVQVSFVKLSDAAQAQELARVVLSVANLADAVAFYEDALGMSRLKGDRQAGVKDRAAEDGPPQEHALMGFPGGTVALELRAQMAPAIGGAVSDSARLFDKIALSVPDLDAAADRVKNYSPSSLVKPPFEVPGVGTHVAIVQDPDGHTLALVDAQDFEKELVPAPV
jgi:catechol 2,3-dioxygenase-like lactoylglutathione lyase family enzyme